VWLFWGTESYSYESEEYGNQSGTQERELLFSVNALDGSAIVPYQGY